MCVCVCVSQVLDDSTKAHVRDKVDAAAVACMEQGHPVQVCTHDSCTCVHTLHVACDRTLLGMIEAVLQGRRTSPRVACSAARLGTHVTWCGVLRPFAWQTVA